MKRLVVSVAMSITVAGVMAGCSKVTEKTGNSVKQDINAVKNTSNIDTTNNQQKKIESSSAVQNQNSDKGPISSGANQNKVNIEQLADNMVICRVGTDPVTVGDYRRLFKLQQMQVQQAITNSPLARQGVLEQAKKLGVTLTADEKKRLLATAKDNQGSDTKFKEFLASKKITEAEFDNEVESLGLAIKTSNAILQQTLLNDLINRAMLDDAAKSAGMSKQATDSFSSLRKSPNYQRFVALTGLTDDQLRNELINDELAKMMIAKIQSSATVDNHDLIQFYNVNRDKFQHKERVRLSQIIISSPTKDAGNTPSLREQVQKANPKLTGANLDAAVTYAEVHQHKLADEVLQRALKGENFAQLANQYSDDSQTRTNKTGGDLGWQEKNQLIPQLTNVIWPLKTGQVYSHLVRTPLGFHIIKVVSHEPAGIAPESDVKDELKYWVTQQKADKTLFDWLQKKRDEMKVSLTPEFASVLNSGTPAKNSPQNNLVR